MRFGIIGTNFISDRLIAAMPFADCRPTAVCSRKRETGEAFAAKHGGMAVYTDMDAFLSSADFEAVYIATPNFLHEAQALAALSAGKHVLVEKPAAPSLAAWRRMREAARERGLVLMEAMRPVHDPSWRRIADALPLLGRLRSVHLDFCQYSSRYDKFLAGEMLNAFNPALSNAALLDIGVYPVAVAAMLFGAPRAVKAQSLMLDGGFEGMGEVLLDYGDFHALITYSKITDSVLPSLLTGEGGSITVDKVSFPTRAVLHARGKEPREISLVTPSAPDNMDAELYDFVRAVEEGDTERLPAHGVSDVTLAVLDECRRQCGIRFPSDGE